MIRQWMSSVLLLFPLVVSAQQMTIAGASSLRPALDQLAEVYMAENPGHQVSVIYGSSGRLLAQIVNGAPFDVFMSADMEFPQQLADQGMAASAPHEYAHGRLALWSAVHDVSAMTLADLARADIQRVAIAQPALAPYGARAQEALMAAGVWDAVQPKLVFGENISQVAQMAESGAADVGIIAVSLAIQPAMSTRPYAEIDAAMHAPLAQGFVITRRGADNPVAQGFAQFMSSALAANILIMNGFAMHGGDHHGHDHGHD
jgi:molybdate transport system substrate-binding protein